MSALKDAHCRGTQGEQEDRQNLTSTWGGRGVTRVEENVLGRGYGLYKEPVAEWSLPPMRG